MSHNLIALLLAYSSPHLPNKFTLLLLSRKRGSEKIALLVNPTVLYCHEDTDLDQSSETTNKIVDHVGQKYKAKWGFFHRLQDRNSVNKSFLKYFNNCFNLVEDFGGSMFDYEDTEEELEELFLSQKMATMTT